jgi:hypothetical protein
MQTSKENLGVPRGSLFGSGPWHDTRNSTDQIRRPFFEIWYFGPLPTSFIYIQLELYTKSMSTQSFVA